QNTIRRLNMKAPSISSLLLVNLFACALPLAAQTPTLTPAQQQAKLEGAKKLDRQLAELYGNGKYEEAAKVAAQAVEIYKKTHGEKHPEYASSLSNLALIYKKLGNYAESEATYLRALAIRKEIFGEKDPEYAASLQDLASLYFQMHNTEKAGQMF